MALADLQTAALLSLVAALLLLLANALPLHHPHRRLRGGGPGAALADLLLAALDRLDLDGRRVLDLATRRNMILLCHAILLLVLRDAGILAPRRSSRSAASAVAAPAANSQAAMRTAIVWRPRRRAAAMRSYVQPPLTGTGPELEEEDPVATKEIILVEEQRAHHPLHRRAGAAPPAAHGDFDRTVVACAEKSKGEAVGEENDEAECDEEHVDKEVDVEEMNRRFEEFIAETKRKMQQESRQLLDVVDVNCKRHGAIIIRN